MKLSIIIPIYNVKNYLEKCIDSVMKQTNEDIEVILVDDGSTDGSEIICDKYMKNYTGKIKVIHQSNKGLSAARNIGILVATGEYIMLLDSDDWIENDILKKIISDLNNYKPEVYVGGAYRIFEDGKLESKMKYSLPRGMYLGIDLVEKYYLTAGNVTFCAQFNIYSKQFLLQHKLSFYEGVLHEDELWTPQIFLLAKKVFNSNVFFYYHFCRNGSITQRKDKSKNANDLIFICNKLQLILENYNKQQIWPFSERIATLYMHSVNIGNLYKDTKINKKFPIINAIRKKTKLKAILFYFSPKYYCKINRLLKKEN